MPLAAPAEVKYFLASKSEFKLDFFHFVGNGCKFDPGGLCVWFLYYERGRKKRKA